MITKAKQKTNSALQFFSLVFNLFLSKIDFPVSKDAAHFPFLCLFFNKVTATLWQHCNGSVRLPCQSWLTKRRMLRQSQFVAGLCCIQNVFSRFMWKSRHQHRAQKSKNKLKVDEALKSLIVRTLQGSFYIKPDLFGLWKKEICLRDERLVCLLRTACISFGSYKGLPTSSFLSSTLNIKDNHGESHILMYFSLKKRTKVSFLLKHHV